VPNTWNHRQPFAFLGGGLNQPREVAGRQFPRDRAEERAEDLDRLVTGQFGVCEASRRTRRPATVITPELADASPRANSPLVNPGTRTGVLLRRPPTGQHLDLDLRNGVHLPNY
jgi:hypothetical protein